MKLNEALPTIFRKPVPLVEAETRVLAAGTLLDTPRRDALLIITYGEGKVQFLEKKGKHPVFCGYPLLAKLLETDPQDYYKFLFVSCEIASLSLRPVAADEELTTVLEGFMRTKFGCVMVEESGRYGLVALADLIPLYQSDVLRTDLSIGEIASPKIFSLPPGANLGKALHEMTKRRIRRVFLSGTNNRFVSDREILTYIFSPERLHLVRESPPQNA